jgi:ATP-dependent RNA helicase DeaD
LNNFINLGLSPTVLKVLDQLRFHEPTPIQEKSIPILLNKTPNDFIGLAQTGTGKTAAFGLPLIERIDTGQETTQALVMAPTRELGQQTAGQLVEFAKFHKGLRIEAVYGGAAISEQIKALRKPTQIIVATPGRLLDLIKRKVVRLQNVRYVVLDEADEMLNMGFKDDIDEILSHTPDDRVTWLFSATMPSEIRKLVKKYMKAPHEISINTSEKINKDISHKYVTTKTADKLSALRRFLDIQPDMRGIMFCRTRRETQQIANKLGSMGYGVEALHGDLSQAQRDAVMNRFRTRSMQLLIATDVAARGIDVHDLTHVLHHTLPDQHDYYTHRSGRTARAGKKGVSLVFINPREGRRIEELERKINVSFEHIEVPSLEEMKFSRINNWAHLIINTRVDEQAEDILIHLNGMFAHLSKNDLLKRLVTSQLDHLLLQGGEDTNLNAQTGKASKKQNKNGFNRYFVNIGLIDGLTKGDLIHFLSDISGIERRHVIDLEMLKNCAFFSIEDSRDTDFTKPFKGITIEGRKIRVNRDDGGRKRIEPNASKKRSNTYHKSGQSSRNTRAIRTYGHWEK